MKITNVPNYENLSEKELKALNKLQELIAAINERGIPDETAQKVQEKVLLFNAGKGNEKDRIKQLQKVKQEILTILQKDLGLVPKDHYASLWMMLGISAFGLPFGTILGVLTENMSYIAIGMPMGIALGYAYGAYLDRKAVSENRVLNLKMD